MPKVVFLTPEKGEELKRLMAEWERAVAAAGRILQAEGLSPAFNEAFAHAGELFRKIAAIRDGR